MNEKMKELKRETSNDIRREQEKRLKEGAEVM